VGTVSEFFMVFQSFLKDFAKSVLENAAMGSSGLIGQSKEGSVMNRPSTVSVVSAHDRPIAGASDGHSEARIYGKTSDSLHGK
jgi:hypothetical protein